MQTVGKMRLGWVLSVGLLLGAPLANAQPNGAVPSITITDPGGAPAVGTPSPAVPDGTPTQDAVGPCGELQRESCDRAGKSFLIAAAAYAALCVVFALLLNRLFYKKGTFGQVGNVFVPVALFATVATVLMGLDPSRDVNFTACIACNEYRGAILLSGLATWPRSVVLGALPVGLLSFVGIVILNRRAT